MSEDLVMANRANNVPRRADTDTTPPVLTGETIGVVHCRGVVEVQRHGDVRLADESPVHTVRAGGQHHGVIVIRQNTARGDAGTFERSAGNRARRADERPLDTVHGTLDRALVVPPMGDVPARDATTTPSPTQTTTTRAAVMAP